LNQDALALAYRHCEQITRTRARNFYYGIRLLPTRKRAAMCALYAMARRIDDVGDDPSRPDRLAALDEVRHSLALVAKAASGEPAAVPPGDPVLIALADTAERFPLPVGAFEELAEGCEWDISGRRYETFDDLVQYCRRVAGTVGRLSLSVYGSADPEQAEVFADTLGVALQLTNILRDLVEDRDVMGRVYLPREDLDRFGVTPDLDGSTEDLMALICFETGRAAQFYARGLPLLALLDWRSRACTATMAGIYHRLLDKVRLRPDQVLRGRISLSRGQKATVAAIALARGRP